MTDLEQARERWRAARADSGRHRTAADRAAVARDAARDAVGKAERELSTRKADLCRAEERASDLARLADAADRVLAARQIELDASERDAECLRLEAELARARDTHAGELVLKRLEAELHAAESKRVGAATLTRAREDETAALVTLRGEAERGERDARREALATRRARTEQALREARDAALDLEKDLAAKRALLAEIETELSRL